jgi:hypothetical protein
LNTCGLKSDEKWSITIRNGSGFSQSESHVKEKQICSDPVHQVFFRAAVSDSVRVESGASAVMGSVEAVKLSLQRSHMTES